MNLQDIIIRHAAGDVIAAAKIREAVEEVLTGVAGMSDKCAADVTCRSFSFTYKRGLRDAHLDAARRIRALLATLAPETNGGDRS